MTEQIGLKDFYMTLDSI